MIKTFMMITTTILALFVSIGLMLSNEYLIKRSITVNAPAAKVHALVADLTQWSQWSPWSAAGVETTIKQAKGVGASQTWKSNQGNGHLYITRCDQNKGMVYELIVGDAKHKTEGGFEYVTQGDKTLVSWYMKGVIDTFVVGGYVAFLTEFMSADMLDSGLEKIKVLAEK